MSYQGIPYPGPTPSYSQSYPPTGASEQNAPFVPSYEDDTKIPYNGGRFQPKKRINDPIFLVLFILTVCNLHSSDVTQYAQRVSR